MPPFRTALITGITGQDGGLLARFLLDMGYIVHGLQRYAANDHHQRIRDLIHHPRFHLHYGDLTDGGSLFALLQKLRPDEVYNLAAMSHVKVSFEMPEYAADVGGLGTLRLLTAIHTLGLGDHTRFYQASSSEMFGNAPAPQNEDTPFAPRSPYAAAKLYAYWLVRNYRDSYGLHASNGILFNHESPVRGEEFVTRKITRTVAMIEAGLAGELVLGNLDAQRDWGHARDYVEGMWQMLQQDTPGDYVLATGCAHSVRDFVTAAFKCAGIQIRWQGHGLDETGIDVASGRTLVKVSSAFFRPNEVHMLIGDASKAQRQLGWRPRTSFTELVHEMMAADRLDIRNTGYDNEPGFYLDAAE